MNKAYQAQEYRAGEWKPVDFQGEHDDLLHLMSLMQFNAAQAGYPPIRIVNSSGDVECYLLHPDRAAKIWPEV